jgi:plastocyanin
MNHIIALGCLLFTVPFFLLPTLSAKDEPKATEAGVAGVVTVEGKPPTPKSIPIHREMEQFVGRNTIEEPTWLVGKNNALANCVVLLRPVAGAAKRDAAPRDEKVIIEKTGIRWTPRITVMNPGTAVVFRNKNSPCKEVMGNAGAWNFAYNIAPGQEREMKGTEKGIYHFSCGVHGYIDGWLLVVDQPYFAVSDGGGKFKIEQIPSGEYDLSLWHEANGRKTEFTGPRRLKVEAGTLTQVDLRVKPPQ